MATSPRPPVEPDASDTDAARRTAAQDDLDTDRGDYVAGVDERPQRRREWSGGLRSVALPLLAVAAIVAAVWYLQDGRGGGVTGEAGTGIVPLAADKNPTGRPAAVEPGRAAPDFVLRTLDGGTIRLSDLRGRTVLLNFWASWCQPCRQEMPELVRAQGELADRGLSVVAIDLQEPDGPVRDFAREFGMRFPVAFDRTGEVARTFRASTQLPTSVLVDADGVVRGLNPGPFTRDSLTAFLGPWLAK